MYNAYQFEKSQHERLKQIEEREKSAKQKSNSAPTTN